jgi:hypothetical protein
MMVVRIELWPQGDESQKRELGVAHVANVGGSTESGNYKVTLFKSPEYAKRDGVWKRGVVMNFPRLRLGPWDLLLRALSSAVGSRNGIGERSR